MLKLAMLPARQGDCLWITYGPSSDPHYLVIDGGPERVRVLRSHVEERPRNGPLHIDLLVVTHIDNDHIGGILDLLEAPPVGLSFGDIWFNAHRHLLPPDLLGPEQGHRLSDILKRKRLPWNLAFGGSAVVIPQRGDLPRIERRHKLYVTVLGPDRQSLAQLHKKWREVVNAPGEGEATSKAEPEDRLGRLDEWPPDIAALERNLFVSDIGEGNGSSIALLIEYEKKRILCTVDAHAARVLAAFERMQFEEERIRLNAFKARRARAAR